MPRLTTVLALAVVAASTIALTACEADESRPTRPRTSNPWSPDQNARDNAEHRALEAPGRPTPVGSGSSTPTQLNKADIALPQERQVVTLQATPMGDQAAPAAAGGGPANNATPVVANNGNMTGGVQMASQPGTQGQPTGWNIIGNYTGPVNQYDRDNYYGPLPHLPANPGTVPMQGQTPVPGTGWSIDHSWGQGLVLQDVPHRSWPDTTAHYEVATVKHNPVYYYNIQPQLNVEQNNGTVWGDWVSNAYEIPWWYLNTAALPVLMVLEPPLAQRTTERNGGDPNYHGHLPETGIVVPTPAPGQLQWEYPKLKEHYAMPGVSTTRPDAEK